MKPALSSLICARWVIWLILHVCPEPCPHPAPVGVPSDRRPLISPSPPVQVFHLPTTQAAANLGIKKSDLARVCERLLPGIRWPQHKLASLEALKTCTEADSRLSEGQVCGGWGSEYVWGETK